MEKRHNIIELVVLKKHETEAALLVHNDLEDKGIWLPKSQVEVSHEDEEGFIEISLPEWLATEKGLI